MRHTTRGGQGGFDQRVAAGDDTARQWRAGAKVSMRFTWRPQSTARGSDSRHNALDGVRAKNGQAESPPLKPEPKPEPERKSSRNSSHTCFSPVAVPGNRLGVSRRRRLRRGGRGGPGGSSKYQPPPAWLSDLGSTSHRSTGGTHARVARPATALVTASIQCKLVTGKYRRKRHECLYRVLGSGFGV